MGIDYGVELSCPVKERFGRQTMLRLLKGRDHAKAVIQAYRDHGDERPSADITFGRTVLTPDTTTVDATAIEDVSAQMLLDQAAVLDPYESLCSHCHANVGRVPFGCLQTIAYPIAAVAETWLLDRLPSDLGSPAGKMLKAAISDLPYKGRSIQEMRAVTGTYFDRSAPASRVWGRGPLRYRITADQLLEMMIGLGELEASHCFMLTVFLGIVPSDVPPAVWRKQATLYQTLSRASLLMDLSEPRIDAWAVFLRALATASIYGLRLWVDT
jgi:hypothetical protein